ncbi:MAG: hypothetical protein AAF394_19390 [Planctomycetota bacterium]
MMQAKTDIFCKQTETEMHSILEACHLPDKEKYTDEEADLIRDCRVLIQQGKTHEEVAHLMQLPTTRETAKKVKSKKGARISKSNGSTPQLDLALLSCLIWNRVLVLS